MQVNTETPKKTTIATISSSIIAGKDKDRPNISSTGQIVLQEEEYVDALSFIIQRDYFPSSSVERNPEEPNADISSRIDVDMTLDDFQVKYTTEDNSSFQQLMEKANMAKKDKYSWVYQHPSTKLLLQGDTHMVKLVEDCKQRPGSVETWEYKTKNSLMYFPEGQGLAIEGPARGKPKEILKNNTRFQEDPAYEHMEEGSSILSDRHDMSPRVAGFGFVASTPTPLPDEMGASPFITWGSLDSTPIKLQPATPLRTDGPGYQLPSTSKRELIGLKLAEKSFRNSKKPFRSSPYTSKLTPGSRKNLLSPAAKSLLKRSTGASPLNRDKQLRSSYSFGEDKNIFAKPTPRLKGSAETKDNEQPQYITDDLLKFNKS